MGAVALSQSDETILGALQKDLRLPSKSQVIHRALEVLRSAVERERLSREIRTSVQKCRRADAAEHESLAGAANYRITGE